MPRPAAPLPLRLLLALFLASPCARAGLETNLVWRWSNPSPFGMPIAALTEVPGERFVAVGDFGQLFTSADLSAWTRADTGTRRWLRAVRYFDPDGNGPEPRRLIVTGEAGTVLVGDADASTFQLVDLGTPDWLEDLAASTDRLVAVGDRAAIHTSSDGLVWTRSTVDFADWLRGVCWRPDGGGGGLFVSVGENGRIASSPDGLTWSRRPSGVATALNRVAPLSNGFLAVGDQGIALLGDATATQWRRVNTGTTADLFAAAQEIRADLPGSPSGASLVAGDGQLRSLLSVLGQVLVTDETQVQRPAPAPRAPYYAAHWTGTEFLVGGAAGLLLEGFRPSITSAFNWYPLDGSPRRFLFDIVPLEAVSTNVTATLVDGAVAYQARPGTNRFHAAVGDGPLVLTSDSGVDWDLALVPLTHGGRVYLGAAGGPGGAVAVGSSGTIAFSPVAFETVIATNRFTNGATLLTATVTNHVNTLGIAWYAVTNTTGTTADLRGVAANGSTYVACGADGTLLTSPDGTTWTAADSPTSALLNGVAAHPGGFVAAGADGTILHSPDAIAWTAVESGVSTDLSRVRWAGDRLIAVGEEGVILTSTDGTTWTARDPVTTGRLEDVAHVADAWYAVGHDGTVIGSADGIRWVPLPSLTTQSLFAVSGRDGLLLAGGAQGVLLRSWPGGFPDPVRMLEWPRRPDQTLFLFTGTPDQRFRLGRSTNLTDWVEPPPLEITDPAGTLILVDPTPNDPERQFFRIGPSP